MNANGGELRRLTRGYLDSEPEWSPDGRRIVFTRSAVTARANPPSDLYVMDSSGSRVRRLTRLGSARSPAWRRSPSS